MDFNIILYGIIVFGVILSLIYFFYKEIYSKRIKIKELTIPNGITHQKFDGIDSEITFNNKKTSLIIDYKNYFQIFKTDEYFLESTNNCYVSPVFIDEKISLYYFDENLYIIIDSQTYKIVLE